MKLLTPYPLAGLAVVMTCVALAPAHAGQQAAPRLEYLNPRVYSADEATRAVAEAPSHTLPGQFAFVVRGSGRDGDRIFLNSNPNYQDPATLTVVVSGDALAALTQPSDAAQEQSLIGRTVVVSGVAQRSRIKITFDGNPTGQFYFQTWVHVVHADQIHVVPGQPIPSAADT